MYERLTALEQLRTRAHAHAQQASADANAYFYRHGSRNGLLDEVYVANERIVDMVEAEIAREVAKRDAAQVADPEAPDYFGIFTSEAEARAAFGDR